MKNIKFVGFVVAIAMVATPISSVYGQSAQWTFSNTMTTNDGISATSVNHSGNRIVTQGTMPYIYVDYPSAGFSIKDEIGSSTYSHFESHTSSGTTYVHAIYYIGCSSSNWPVEGCYKYEEFYYYIDSNGSIKPQFKHWLKIYGNGFTQTYGTPTYRPHWRMDTDILGSIGDKYEQYGSGWTLVSTEASYADNCNNGEDGAEWRTYDNTNGITKRVGIAPVCNDNAKIWILKYNTGQTDGSPDTYLNSESVNVQDDVYWLMLTRVASTTCKSTAPCTTGPTLYLTGL